MVPNQNFEFTTKQFWDGDLDERIGGRGCDSAHVAGVSGDLDVTYNVEKIRVNTAIENSINFSLFVFLGLFSS